MRIKKIVKIMFFSIGAVSTLLAIWSICIKIKPNEKAKQHKIGANWMEFQQSMSYNL
jgi:bacteriorhodopsin